MEEALIEVPTMRRFAGIDMISDRIPDETTKGKAPIGKP
jgi:IS5 family transposase